jgi:hypothetical protein
MNAIHTAVPNTMPAATGLLWTLHPSRDGERCLLSIEIHAPVVIRNIDLASVDQRRIKLVE